MHQDKIFIRTGKYRIFSNELIVLLNYSESQKPIHVLNFGRIKNDSVSSHCDYGSNYIGRTERRLKAWVFGNAHLKCLKMK